MFSRHLRLLLKGLGAGLVAPFQRETCLAGKQGLGVALLWGGLTALALPPLFLLPVGLVGLAAWFRLVDCAASPRYAFCLGGTFAFGYFLGGLWWIAVAFRYESTLLAWAGLPLVVLLAAGLALFWAVASYGARLARQGVVRVGVFTTAVLAVELARGVVFGGFPWNPIASFWAFSAVTLQPLALFGSDLWSACTLLACASVVALVYRQKQGKAPRQDKTQGSVAVVASASLLALFVALPLAVVLVTGARLAVAPPQQAEWVAGLRLRIVQPALAQEDKWNRTKRRENLALQQKLLTTPGNFTHAILPEATVAWPLNTATTVRAVLAAAVPQGGSLVIGGITRLNELESGDSVQASAQTSVPRLHNSLYLLDDTGAITARYDKHKLVPFGEFIPFNRWLSLARLTDASTDAQRAIDYTPGTGLLTLASADSALPPFSPLICFEVIFSGRVAQSGTARADWLVNLTNDAWFGRTSGPYQHFAAARMRAVEEGLPLVRAANNGISAVIDGRGRIQSLLPLGARGVLDANLPQALPATLFALYGLRLPLLALTVLVMLCLCGQFFPQILRRI